MVTTERLAAHLRLHLADGVGAVTFQRLLEAFGDVQAVAEASLGQLESVDGVGPKKAQAVRAVTDQQVEEELVEAERRGVRILCREDDDFPAALKTIYDCPAVLYVRGQLRPTDAVSMGVVGSRRCTHYGLEQAERFGQLLGRAGFCVVSGGARGIDTAAHRGAMAAGGRTLAVMGCGLSQTYPPENAALFEQIVAEGRGALVSELPMRTAVMGGNFPTRNRVISGLSLGVLIVEAARRSGSLHTAREAAEQGRTVFAIPGRVDSPLSQGANELIRGGAILTQDLPDILEHLGPVGEKIAAQEDAQPPAEALPAGLSPAERTLMETLRDGPLDVDELARRSRLDSGRVISAMTMLVLKGAVAQQPGNVFARRAPRG